MHCDDLGKQYNDSGDAAVSSSLNYAESSNSVPTAHCGHAAQEDGGDLESKGADTPCARAPESEAEPMTQAGEPSIASKPGADELRQQCPQSIEDATQAESVQQGLQDSGGDAGSKILLKALIP